MKATVKTTVKPSKSSVLDTIRQAESQLRTARKLAQAAELLQHVASDVSTDLYRRAEGVVAEILHGTDEPATVRVYA